MSRYLETIKAVDGKVFHLEYHQQRYERVLKSLGVRHYKKLQEYINPPKNGLFRCRILYSMNNISISYHEYEKRKIETLKIVYDDLIDYQLKAENRENLNALYNKRELYDDVLIVKSRLLTDTTIANIALYKDGVWYTPKEPLLCGTTRERLLKEKKIVAKNIYIDDIFDYTKVALLNAMVDFDIIQKENIRGVIC